MPENLTEEVKKDFSGEQKNFVVLNFLNSLSKSKVLVSKKTGTVFHNDIVRSDINLKDWNKIFSKKIDPEKKLYTSNNPIMNSRHYYGVKFLENFLNYNMISLSKKLTICDFGSGEGNFPILLKKNFKKLNIFLCEYSKSNIEFIKKKIKSEKIHIDKLFNCSIEDFEDVNNFETIDIATLNWTLCNCSNPINVLKSIYNSLKTCKKNIGRKINGEEGGVKSGYLMIAESSRILVPFKKPINNYFNSKAKSSYHPWHFSFNSLNNLLEISNFRIVHRNRYFDENDMFVIAKKMDNKNHKPRLVFDNYSDIVFFFKKWKRESLFFNKFLKKI